MTDSRFQMFDDVFSLNTELSSSRVSAWTIPFHFAHAPLGNYSYSPDPWSNDHIITLDGISLACPWSVRNAGVTFGFHSHINLTYYKVHCSITLCFSVPLQSFQMSFATWIMSKNSSLQSKAFFFDNNATATLIILVKPMPPKKVRT